MAAEESVRSGRDGEKIVKELLSLIGWGSTSNNFNIDCAFPKKHETKNHGLDVVFSYENPLYHNQRDIVIGSVKHSKGAYSSGIKSQINKDIKELTEQLDCVKESDDILKIVGSTDLETKYKGVLFCLSSSNEEKHKSLTEYIDYDLDFKSNVFEEVYLVDNQKASFLISCIKTAENYRSSASIKFLYQNTGKNMDKEQLLLSGDKLPVQLINSEIIPIVKESKDKISCLLFCNNPYKKEVASRLIWLSHKLCGYTNEIRIYLPDYDNNFEFEINGVKQQFKDNNFTERISFHRLNFYDFVSLKEKQESENSNNYYSQNLSEKVEVRHSNLIDDDIDKILPYGDILLPKLKTSILSEYNLRYFLLQKGIITLKHSKDSILPIFSCLLLSPNELDNLKTKYKEKEDKPKEIERIAQVNLKGRSLWESFNSLFPNLKEISKLKTPANCSIKSNPKLERVNSDYNHLIVKYVIEKENTNKDFLNGKTSHHAEVEIKYDDKTNQLVFTERHTSSETYKLNKKYYNQLKNSLKKNDLLSEDFKAITFFDFNNNQRIQFLLSFFELRDSSLITIENMTLESIKLRADSSMNNLPDDLESLKGRVSNLNLYGKELNDTIYLSEERYRNAVMCEKMKYSIQYKYINRKGICDFEIYFKGALGRNEDKDAELLISLSPANYSFDNNFSNTKNAFNREIKRIKELSYEKHKQSSLK